MISGPNSILRGQPYLGDVDLRTDVLENHMLITSNVAYIRTVANQIAWKILTAAIELMKNTCWMWEPLAKSKTYQCFLSPQMSHAISMLLQPYDVQKLEGSYSNQESLRAINFLSPPYTEDYIQVDEDANISHNIRKQY